MTTKQWASMKPVNKDWFHHPDVIRMFDGVPFRARGAVGAAHGTVFKQNGGLALKYSSGETETLTPAACVALEFAISPDTVAPSAKMTYADKCAVVAKMPPWAQRIVARALMPETVVAIEREEQEARRDYFRAVGGLASGKKLVKPLPAIRPPEPETAILSKEARRAQLREIGKAASRK